MAGADSPRSDFWGYFEPIRQYMPQNCSADVQAVIAHIDQVFTSGNRKEIDHIKALFNMSALTHLDDVAIGAVEVRLLVVHAHAPTRFCPHTRSV